METEQTREPENFEREYSARSRQRVWAILGFLALWIPFFVSLPLDGTRSIWGMNANLVAAVLAVLTIALLVLTRRAGCCPKCQKYAPGSSFKGPFYCSSCGAKLRGK